jgi:hypothetical protein
MIVGRATADDYGHCEFPAFEDVSAEDACGKMKDLNRFLVEKHPRSSRFWQAVVKGSQLCGDSPTLANTVWTNLGKIGLADKDIDDRFFAQQSELAERTLRAELVAYKPTLVHLAVGKLGGPTILEATGTQEEHWHRLAGPHDDVWFLEGRTCSFLWTRHPNWAPPDIRQAWESQLAILAERRSKFQP